jgi:hypothetical protein
VHTIGHTLRLRCDVVELRGSADAGYASHATGHGHDGGIVFIGRAPIIIISKKQSQIAESSTEAEIFSLNKLANAVIWVRHMLRERGYTQNAPTPIEQDNMSAIHLMEHGRPGKPHTRHYLALRQFAAQGKIQEGLITLVHTGTNVIKSDGLTKAQEGVKFSNFKEAIQCFSNTIE